MRVDPLISMFCTFICSLSMCGGCCMLRTKLAWLASVGGPRATWSNRLSRPAGQAKCCEKPSSSNTTYTAGVAGDIRQHTALRGGCYTCSPAKVCGNASAQACDGLRWSRLPWHHLTCSVALCRRCCHPPEQATHALCSLIRSLSPIFPTPKRAAPHLVSGLLDAGQVEHRLREQQGCVARLNLF